MHISWELDQTLSLEPVVEAVIDIVETGADNLDFEQHWCNALVVFIYFIKYRVYLIELFYLCDLLMFI